MIDFESRPDVAGSNMFSVPMPIAANVFVDAPPGTDMYDVNNNDTWGIGCPIDGATARSGVLFIGAAGGSPSTFTINFDFAVSRVALYVGDFAGSTYYVSWLDGGGAPLASTLGATGDCPSLDNDDIFNFDAGANVIRAVRITGEVPFVDDISYWRFQ